MKQQFFEIDKKIFEQIPSKNTWSLGSMEAHGAEGRSVEYIGSKISKYFLDNDVKKGKVVFDYFKDVTGRYWYKTRAMLPSGEVVSMDVYLFGHEIRERHRRHTKRRY